MSGNSVLVELHVPDFNVAREFYGLLGFRFEREESNYLVLRKGEQLLAFYGGTPEVANHSYFRSFPADTKRGYGIEITIFDTEIETLFERIKGRVTVVTPPTLRHWGCTDFRVVDPFGFYLRISEPYDVTVHIKDPHTVQGSDPVPRRGQR